MFLLIVGTLALPGRPGDVSADDWKPKAPADDSQAEADDAYMIYSASYALVIGIDAYTNGWPRLANAVRDAREVSAALESIGFEVDLRTDLTSSQLGPTIKEFFVTRGQDDDARLLLWYAGHGHTIQGEGFLVPADAPVDSDPQFKLKALHMRDFGSYVRLAESKHALAIFDSCFSGTIFDTPRSAPPSAISWATDRPVRQFLSSGDANQTVLDDGTFRSVFVGALRGSEPADSNRDGYLTASELGLFMTDRILNLTQSRQTPRFGKLRDRDWDQGDFVLTIPGQGRTSPDSPDRDRRVAGRVPSRQTKGIITIRLANPPRPSGALESTRRPASRKPTPRPAPVSASSASSASPERAEPSLMDLVELARRRRNEERKNRLVDRALKESELAQSASICRKTCETRFRDVERQRNWLSERSACNSSDYGWDQCVEAVKTEFRRRLVAECQEKC